MRRWLKHYEAYGECLYQTERRYNTRQWKASINSEQTGDPKAVIDDEVFEDLRKHLEIEPLLYLDEMKTYLRDRHGHDCTIATIKLALKRHNITRKLVYSKASQVIESRRLALIHHMRHTLTDIKMLVSLFQLNLCLILINLI